MSEENSKELTLIRIFNASKELVFKAWTNPEIVAKWWGPKGVTNPTCELDAKPGGNIYIVMLAGEELGPLKGQKWPMRGKFKEVIPPEKLVFTSQAIMDGKPILETLCTVSFGKNGKKTKMTVHIVVTKTTPQAEGPLKGMETGWSQSLDKLEELVTGA